MTLLFGLALLGLGLVIGFVVTWAIGVGPSIGLFVGILLVVAGAVIGFVVEWLIDEAYRKNRELRRQVSQGPGAGAAQVVVAPAPAETPYEEPSEALSGVLQQREQEIQELRQQVQEMDNQIDHLHDEFEDYQQSHPDDLTVIKGIGSVYQWKLRDVGIHTYQQLAHANPAQLRRMLDVKEWQRVDIESWIEQAQDWAQREV